MAKSFDYKEHAGMYNRFLAEGGSSDIMSHKDLQLYDLLTGPSAAERPGAETAQLMDSRSGTGQQFSRDALLTEALFRGHAGSKADSLKLVEALSPAGRKVYENFYQPSDKKKSTTEDKIINGFLQQDNKYKMGK